MIRYRRCSVAILGILSTVLLSCEKQEEAIIPVSGIIVSPHSMRLTEGDEEKLEASVFPENATDKTITWHTSDKSVVTVEDGSVIALAPGEADVEASAGGKYDKCHITVTPRHIPVESVTLDWTAITLTEEESTVVTATVHPENASDKSVSWSSSNPEIASVSEGRIVAEKAGQAVITVTATDGNKTAECTVSVLERIFSVVSVSLDQTSASLTEGETLQLTATVSPDNATNKSISWTSSNASVATVSADGLVSAVAPGTATIRVTTADGGKTAECTVQVNARIYPVTAVSLDRASATLTEGETLQLTATVSPDNATNKNISWSSTNTTVATVSADGLVSAVAPGTATIRVTTADGGKTAECAVTVEARIYPVTAVSLDRASATLTEGETLQLTATVSPDNATNKTVSWTSTNSSVATVNQNGLVTAIAEGSATIKVTTIDGQKTAECSIIVNHKYIPVSSISLEPVSVAVAAGGSTTLIATVYPANADDRIVVWESSDNSVVTVDQNGKISGINEGTATITASAGGKSATCSVEVAIPLEALVLNETEVELYIGEVFDLQYSKVPSNATVEYIKNASSNETVARINWMNKISALSEGAADITITAVTALGNVSAYCHVIVRTPVSSISLSQSTATLVEGESMDLTATVLPENAYDKSVSWESSNLSVATVNSSGKVTAVKEGNATITARAGKCSAKCTVNVEARVVAVSSISLNQTNGRIPVGGTLELFATVLPSNATNKTVIWTTSAPSIATVEQNGVVTGVAAGTATIQATTQDGGKIARCNIEVFVPATSISINNPNGYAYLTVGEQLQLTATILPEETTYKTITWTSREPEIASVDSNGLVTAIKKGYSVITAEIDGVAAVFTVHCKDNMPGGFEGISEEEW